MIPQIAQHPLIPAPTPRERGLRECTPRRVHGRPSPAQPPKSHPFGPRLVWPGDNNTTTCVGLFSTLVCHAPHPGGYFCWRNRCKLEFESRVRKRRVYLAAAEKRERRVGRVQACDVPKLRNASLLLLSTTDCSPHLRFRAAQWSDVRLGRQSLSMGRPTNRTRFGRGTGERAELKAAAKEPERRVELLY